MLADPDAGLAAIASEDEESIGEGELFGAAVAQAYEALTGREIWDDFPERPSADFPDGEPSGPEVTGDRKERRRRYPQLAAKYPARGKLHFPWRR